jgi:hypothetical protein
MMANFSVQKEFCCFPFFLLKCELQTVAESISAERAKRENGIGIVYFLLLIKNISYFPLAARMEIEKI